MGKYWRLLGQYDAETATYSACAGPMQTSPYTPDEDAQLIGLRALVSRTSAATLTDSVQFRLTCTTFKPNTIHTGALGSGLQTAPTTPAEPIDWTVQQPVKAGVPITVEGRCNNASAVTNDVELYGLFQS